MAGRQLAALELSENECAALRLLVAWRSTAQAMALRARIVARRPRWHVHALACASDPDQLVLAQPEPAPAKAGVERFLALLTERQIRRGVHRSIDAPHAAIDDFIERHNADPKPFRWTKSADDILVSIERFCLYYAPSHSVV